MTAAGSPAASSEGEAVGDDVLRVAGGGVTGALETEDGSVAASSADVAVGDGVLGVAGGGVTGALETIYIARIHQSVHLVREEDAGYIDVVSSLKRWGTTK